jgi:hypothetical protein
VVSADAVTVKFALVEPAAMFTEAGDCSALLLLERATTVWLVAVTLSETEHAVVVGPVNFCVAHDSWLSVAVGAVVAGLSVIKYVCETPPTDAARDTVCFVLRADAVTLNTAAVAPAATFTDAGV